MHESYRRADYADHGFNCDHRSAYNETAAPLARERTLGFFAS